MDRLHITWNAADAYDYFMENGIDARPPRLPTPEEITHTLSKQKGRLFRLLAHLDELDAEVVLKITDGDEQSIHIVSEKPPLDMDVTVADVPPPSMTTHGDYRFDLVPYIEQ